MLREMGELVRASGGLAGLSFTSDKSVVFERGIGIDWRKTQPWVGARRKEELGVHALVERLERAHARIAGGEPLVDPAVEVVLVLDRVLRDR